ncbi:MAG: DUF362 domain-containing protein [Bacillota bacterium]|nr:DUF362 domain-containing protein [Bacillota bacterium]
MYFNFSGYKRLLYRFRDILLILLLIPVLILPGACKNLSSSTETEMSETATRNDTTTMSSTTAVPTFPSAVTEAVTTSIATDAPSPTLTAVPTPTIAPTVKPTPTRSPTVKPTPSRTPTAKPTPTVAPTKALTPTPAPASTEAPDPTEPAIVNAVVGLGFGKDYATTTAKAIANAGGLARVVKSGNTVLIKPNLCWSNITSRPVNTDYRVVAEIVRQVRALGAGRIIIAEGPFGPECFTESMLAYNHYDRIADVELVSLNTLTADDCYERTGRNSVTGKALFIPKIYIDADVVITVAKMKTHNAGMVTLGLKNAFGVPPRSIYGTSGSTSGSKLLLHNDYDFNAAIVEINLIRTPDFVVIDGIVAGEGSGPLKNTPVDAQIIIAGRDIVAVDTVAATFMGFNTDKIPHLSLAHSAGLGEGDLEKIKVVGGNLADLVIDFDSIFPKD